MTAASPPTAASCRLPPEPASASRARRFVAEALVGCDANSLDAAQLLVSELVTNAVLHAQTDVQLRLWTGGGRVQVRVTDFDERSLVPRRPDTEAATGRGLQLVEALAASYGVDRFAGGKTVWFELWPDLPSGDAQGSWSDADPGPADRTRDGVHVVFDEIPTGLYLAAQRHAEALLRECALHAMVHGDVLGHSAASLAEARLLHQLLAATVGRAVLAGRDRLRQRVFVTIPAACAAAAPILGEILDSANGAAREGLFLTRPALPEIRAFRNWLLGQLGDQQGGAAPQPWHAPASASAGRPLAASDWQPADAARSTVATVTADDDNRIVAVNDAAAELFGWPADELVGQRIVALIPPEWRERHVVGFTNFLLTGESHVVGAGGIRVPALHRHGHIVPVVFRVRVDQAPSGRVVFVAEFSKDVADGTGDGEATAGPIGGQEAR